MKNIVVTGGCGFIGSHIVDRLVDTGYHVTVIDDCSAVSNEHFYFNKKALYFKYSIQDYDLIEPLFRNVDFVFHLAAESRIQTAISNPLYAVKTNVTGTANILNASKLNGVKRVIYSSTSSVYGLNETVPIDETAPIDCLNPYSATKFCGEELCRMYSKLYKLDTLIFRYFNVYGERSPTAGQYAPVVGIFLRQKADKKPLTVVGSGTQRRDYVHVSDIAKANILGMKVEGPISGQVYNVGTGKNYSVLEIANMISKNITHIPERPGEAKTTLANIEKIQKTLNFNPEISIESWLKNHGAGGI